MPCTTATLDCINPRVDKAHAPVYLTWTVQSGQHFLFGGSIDWFLAALEAECGAGGGGGS